MAGKKAAGEGSIRYRKKQKCWEGRYTALGQQKSVYGKTREECAKKMRAMQNKLDCGEYIETQGLTVGQWLQTWMKEYAALTLRASTYVMESKIVDKQLVPALGKIRLQQLRVDQVQTFVNNQVRGGYAPATIKRQLSVLKVALKQAVDNQLLIRNPASSAKLPKMEEKETNHLSPEEQQALLGMLPMSTYGRALRFILGTGLRVSELCGLRWCDIDEEGIHVNQVTYCVKRGAVDDLMGVVDAFNGEGSLRICNPPKTKAGKRFIPLHLKLWAILEEQKHAQRLERVRAGSAWLGDEPCKGGQYVFATAVGTPTERHNIARVLRECLIKAGVATRGVHALRHTFATNWVQNGGDLRTLSEILGHTNVAFTMQRYVHSSNDVKKKWMEEMAGYL